jgi:hypothetical protein
LPIAIGVAAARETVPEILVLVLAPMLMAVVVIAVVVGEVLSVTTVEEAGVPDVVELVARVEVVRTEVLLVVCLVPVVVAVEVLDVDLVVDVVLAVVLMVVEAAH